METKLYVGNLSHEIAEKDLLDLFAQAGSVNQVRIIQDRVTGRPKGYAFVTMKSQEDANKAIELFNGYFMSSRELVVNLAKPREQYTMSNYDSNQGDRNQSNYPRNRNGGSQSNS